MARIGGVGAHFSLKNAPLRGMLLRLFMSTQSLHRCTPRKDRKQAVFADGVARKTLSFYRYTRIVDPEHFRATLEAELTTMGCLGRIYVASEGINAQMNVPEDNWEKFDTYVQSVPELKDVPYKIAVEDGSVPSSFYKLTIKIKDKIVADGLTDDLFDVTTPGEYITAEEMNAYIDDPEAVVIDMRNSYESEIGHFEGAITPDVDTFREELAVTPEKLKIHKNKKIALYCTGGIRCEKASAWLKHNGFKDVKHLQGGIIEYAHQVKEKGLENKFKGKNFVFDERLGERISDEIISHCHLCSVAKTDTHYHCNNLACNVLFLGCDSCITKKKNYCSYKCLVFDHLPERYRKWRVRHINRAKISQFKKNRLHAKQS